MGSPHQEIVTPEHEANLARAERDLEHITRLLDADAWAGWLVPRLQARRSDYSTQLEADQPEPKTAELRARIRELDEILRLPHQDRTSHASTLASGRLVALRLSSST